MKKTIIWIFVTILLSSSAFAIVCGNGIIELGEVCDDGTLNSDVAVDGCRMSCRDAYCGDGVTDTGEECDQGYHQAIIPNVCRDDCTLPYCGDGVLDDDKMGLNGPYFYEECDDGNNKDNDGCRNCKLMSNLKQDMIIPPIDHSLLVEDSQITRYQNKIMNKFKRGEILPLLQPVIGNQKANVYSVDEFILCFETSSKYFEGVTLEECNEPTIKVIFSEKVLDALDESENDNSVIIQMYKEGEIDVQANRFFNKVKFGIIGTIGKFVLKFIK